MALYEVEKDSSGTPTGTKLVAGGTLYAANPVGTILPFGGTNIPTGWGLCDGRAVSRTTYSELFAVIGTSFGAGNGSTTFNLPDMRGKFAEGLASGDTLGASKTAGLPNIEGQINGPELLSRGNSLPDFPITGVFTGTQYAKTTRNNDASDAYGASDITFDASKSNSIYGNSNTVQPPAVCVNYIICMKQTAVPADFLAKVDEAVEEVYGDIIPSDASARNKLLTQKYIVGEIFPPNTTKVIHSSSNNVIEILGMPNNNTDLLDTAIVVGYSGQMHYFDKGNVNPTITYVYDSTTNTYNISITTSDTFIVSIMSCRGVTIS